MLMKSFLNVPGDYEKTLKYRQRFALAFLALGLVGEVCYHFLVPQSGLPEFAQGFYQGGAAGILMGALILLVRTRYLLRHPEARKKAQVKEQDEREVTIVNNSFRLAGWVTFFGSAGALFVVLPLNMGAFYALLAAMAVYAITFAVGNAYYGKKL